MSAGTESRLASPTVITPELRAAWLAERRHSLGASEVAAIVGADPHRTPLDVWMQKVHPGEPEPPTRQQRIGLLMEPVIAQLYEDETGQAIVQQQTFLRDGFRSATLDGVRRDGRIVEFKTVHAHNRGIIDQIGEAGTDEVPPVWMWQLTAQMDLAGRDVADLAVLIGGGDFRVFTVARHPRLADHARARAEAFWRTVEDEQPPPMTTPDDCRHLAMLYREANSEVELSEDGSLAASEYERLGLIARAAERERAEHRLAILAALGPNAVGRLPDGRTVRRSVVEVKAHEVRASTQVRLSIKGGS